MARSSERGAGDRRPGAHEHRRYSGSDGKRCIGGRVIRTHPTTTTRRFLRRVRCRRGPQLASDAGRGRRAGTVRHPAGTLDRVTDRPVRVRFAPSPTGYFHVGGAAHRPLQLDLRPPARGHVRPAHRGHRRRAQPPRVDRGHPDRAALDRRRLGRGARSSSPRGVERHREAAGRSTTRRRPTTATAPATQIDARTKGNGHAGLRRLLPRPRPRGRARAGRCASARPGGRHHGGRPHPGHAAFEHATSRTSWSCGGNGDADVPPGQRGRRHRHGHHPRHPGRGAPAQHAQGPAAVGGARRRPSRPRGPTCRCS